jgi:uncharacterized protein YndB with AHSA1/START domain
MTNVPADLAARTIVLTRVINASPLRIWTAYTNADSLAKWWGPNGFVITTLSADIRVGGSWRFDMMGPDGKRWPNLIEYQELVPGERMVFKHGSDDPNDPNQFVTTITFTEQAGKTLVTHSMLLASVEQVAFVKGFGAVELGHQTLAKLASFVEAEA